MLFDHLCHSGCMVVQITIRNVPVKTRDALKSKAAAGGRSMQAYLLRELKRMAEMPSNAELMREVEERLKASGRSVPVSEILKYRGRD